MARQTSSSMFGIVELFFRSVFPIMTPEALNRVLFRRSRWHGIKKCSLRPQHRKQHVTHFTRLQVWQLFLPKKCVCSSSPSFAMSLSVQGLNLEMMLQIKHSVVDLKTFTIFCYKTDLKIRQRKITTSEEWSTFCNKTDKSITCTKSPRIRTCNNKNLEAVFPTLCTFCKRTCFNLMKTMFLSQG